MTPIQPPQPLRPPPNTGLVVFVRPSSWGGGAYADILDEAGHFVGRTSGGAHFATVATPGPHMFAVWGENTDAVQIDVAPGHIYFVEVGITPGWLTAQFHLYAISPRTPTWANRDEWVRSTRQMQVDPAGQALFNGRESDVAERLRRAPRASPEVREHAGAGTSLHRAERRHLAASRGLPPTALAALVAAAHDRPIGTPVPGVTMLALDVAAADPERAHEGGDTEHQIQDSSHGVRSLG